LIDNVKIREENPLPSNFGDRRGKFRVSKNLINSIDRNMMNFMSNFFIVRAEFLLDIECMEYYALSELFEPIDIGFETPEYEFTITKMENGDLDIIAKRSRPEAGFKLLRKLRKLDL